MTFRETELGGVFLLELERREDERGFFARAWSREELEERGLSTQLEQCNLAYNEREGTLRGLHFQLPPYEDVKIVRCTAGGVFDVVVDDEVLYSKQVTGRRAKPGEVFELFRDRVVPGIEPYER